MESDLNGATDFNEDADRPDIFLTHLVTVSLSKRGLALITDNLSAAEFYGERCHVSSLYFLGLPDLLGGTSNSSQAALAIKKLS